MKKQVLNKYRDLKTGKEFFVWETERQYENRANKYFERYLQIPFELEEYKRFLEVAKWKNIILN